MATVNDTETKLSTFLSCIDLSNPNIHQSAVVLKQACMDSGFFYVINHGISEEFMNKVFAQTQKFFSLPKNEKMKVLIKRDRGYKTNTFIDQETNERAQGEAFITVHDEAENIWPPADVFPGWKEMVLRYQQEALNVGRALAKIIAVALDLDAEFFSQPGLLGNNVLSTISFNRYTVEQVDPSKEYVIGSPAHSDPYLITLLATNDVPGLQICRNIDAKPRLWEDVLPLKGAFIVNIGQTLERMSNCVFRSTMHRVLHRQERYSIAFFASPSYDYTIECIPSCKSAENPPKYLPIKCKDFMDIIFNRAADDRKVTDFTRT